MRPISWFRQGGGIDWPRVLLVVLGLAVVVAIGVLSTTSSTAFGPYNPAWDGASDLREHVGSQSGVDAAFVTDTGRYEAVDPNATVAFVIAPSEPYESDADDVRRFVDHGGTLVVFEDFGENGNRLLEDVGAQARLDGRVVRDERHHLQAPMIPIATGIANHTLTQDIDRLTLNYATAVRPANATVLVRTSSFSYLATDENETIDDDNELAAYPVATVESIGSGSLVVVGDPSITINAMREKPDNAAFIDRLYHDADVVLFDVSHNQGLPPLTYAVLVFRDSPLWQGMVGGLGILGVAILGRWRLRARIPWVPADILVGRSPQAGGPRRADSSPGLSDEERAQYLRRQHPEWDEDRIQRVIAALKTSPSKRGNESKT